MSEPEKDYQSFEVVDPETGQLILRPIEEILTVDYTKAELLEGVAKEISLRFNPQISKLAELQESLSEVTDFDSAIKLIKETSKEFDAVHKSVKKDYTPVIKFIDSYKTVKNTVVGLFMTHVDQAKQEFILLNKSPEDILREKRQAELDEFGGQSYGMDLAVMPEIAWDMYVQSQRQIADTLRLNPELARKPAPEKQPEPKKEEIKKESALQKERYTLLAPYLEFVHKSVNLDTLDKLTEKRFNDILVNTKADALRPTLGNTDSRSEQAEDDDARIVLMQDQLENEGSTTILTEDEEATEKWLNGETVTNETVSQARETSEVVKKYPISHKDILLSLVDGFIRSSVDISGCSPKYRAEGEEILAKFDSFKKWAIGKVESIQ